jgi:hypothetical protein
MLKPLVLLAIVATGWALGRLRPQVNLFLLALTLFAAVSGHSAVQTAVFENRLHVTLGDPRADAPAIYVVPIAAGEAVGLWLPFLLIPWAPMRARVWAGLYALSAALAAALTFYFPFDGMSFDSDFFPSDGPPYLLAAFVCLPIAAVGYLAGWMKAKLAD